MVCQRKYTSALFRLEVTLQAHVALSRAPEVSSDNPLFSSRRKILGRIRSRGDSAHENLKRSLVVV